MSHKEEEAGPPYRRKVRIETIGHQTPVGWSTRIQDIDTGEVISHVVCAVIYLNADSVNTCGLTYIRGEAELTRFSPDGSGDTRYTASSGIQFPARKERVDVIETNIAAYEREELAEYISPRHAQQKRRNRGL